MKFLYKKASEGIYFPIINILASYKKNAINLYTLVDSGATISIFKPEVAETLKIKIEDGKSTTLGGVGGEIHGYIHNLNLQIANKTVNTPIVFSRQYNVSFNLLGRSKVFDNFKIIFEEYKLLITLE